jgi:hypothetical protein
MPPSRASLPPQTRALQSAVAKIVAEDPALDIHQLAAFLGVNSRTASRLCAGGRIPAKDYNVGGRKHKWRVRLSDAMRFRETPDNEPVPLPEPSRDRLPPHITRLV